jgi:hypothetical protein
MNGMSLLLFARRLIRSRYGQVYSLAVIVTLGITDNERGKTDNAADNQSRR